MHRLLALELCLESCASITGPTIILRILSKDVWPKKHEKANCSQSNRPTDVTLPEDKRYYLSIDISFGLLQVGALKKARKMPGASQSA